jgi:DnaK suppressor protein
MTEAKRSRSLGTFETLLRARRDKLVADGPSKIEPNRRDASAVGVADEDEQALSEMLQTLASTRNRDHARELAEIDRALRKLHDDPEEFGVCEDCGDDIPAKRLEVMPFARFCAECQASADPKRNLARKSVTDYK